MDYPKLISEKWNLTAKFNCLQAIYFDAPSALAVPMCDLHCYTVSHLGPYVSRYAWFEYEFLNRAGCCTKYWPHFFILHFYELCFDINIVSHVSVYLFYLNVQTYRVKELLMTG